MKPLNTDVLIVGAGPAGLALANTLARAGVRFLVLDRLAQGQNTSRAAVLHAHTLEMLEPLGVCVRLEAAGLKLAKFSIRDRARALVSLCFDALPSRYAGILMVPQNVTEEILADALVAAGGKVGRGWMVESVIDLGDRVRAIAARGAERRAIDARYVVGADGMHSVVRHTAGIGFSGHRYDESFVLADVEMQWSHGRDEVKLYFSPAGLVVVAPLPAGTFRIVATLADAPEFPGEQVVQAILDARGPQHGSAKVSKVVWSSRFRIHHRVADRYRSGRFLLVGDAAHVHSPAGGQGMNTGLVDAVVLGRMLGDVLAGRRDDAFLDAYEDLRRPAAVQVLGLAGRLTRLATMKRPEERLVRNVVLSLVNRLPFARRRLEMALSGLSRRDAALVPGHPPQRDLGPRALIA
ncbi:MAG TPA: FAD-dependent monooxygenase [Burkholderiales bacterium]|nr:FAD-dependent monooxygenase [Burkholderiales bacterium]